MAYSSNFNLDGPERRREGNRVERPSAGLPPDRSRSLRAPRTTNRVTVDSGASRPLSSRSQEVCGQGRGQARPGSMNGGDRGRARADRSSSRPVGARGSQSVNSRSRSSRSSQGRASDPRRASRQGQGRKKPPVQTQRPPQGYAPRKSDSFLTKVFDVLKGALLLIVRGIAALGRGIARGFGLLWSKSKVAGGILALVLVLAGAFAVDSLLTADKVYRGVFVGDVDVANMTQEEAASAIEARYGDKLANTSVYIFSSEETAKNTDVDQVQKQEAALAEQVSVEQALENKVLWVETANTLGARLPSQELAAEAVQFGRSTGIFDRFSTLMHEHDIPVRLDYNETIMDKLVSDLDTVIGDPAEESSITIDGVTASVVEGHDGYMIDEQTFIDTLTDKLLNSEVDDPRYIPVAEYVGLKVDGAQAQKTADAVTEALKEGASFSYGSESCDLTPEELGGWISAEPAERREGEWYLKPTLSEARALSTLTETLNLSEEGDVVKVAFDVQDDGITVKPESPITVPDVGNALTTLEDALFGSFDKTGTQQISGPRYDIAIKTEEMDGPFSLDAALAFGVVKKFSTFTTQFNTATNTMNRLYNIQKVADLIDDSVIPADGGRWSFNDTAGDCNAEAGFKEAGVISGDEMTQEAGGGVCQVATTVFNSVYNAGLKIDERHNHTLRSSAYPDGLDAAIAYPTLDLVWENDTPSDILLTTSYDSYSITVNLIGEDPERTVSTQTGEWGEGDPYKVKVEVDEMYAPKAVVKMTNGSDGSTINVTRTVTDKDGNQLYQETFSSIYSPMNVLVKVGSEVDIAEIQERYKRPDDEDQSSSSAGSSASSSSSSSSKTTTT